MTVKVRDEGGVRVIALANPPVNALSVAGGTVATLRDALRAAAADASVRAVIVTGEGRMFCGGADIKDFDGDMGVLSITRETLDETEALSKPVVAAVHGMALGGGLELALSCHYRVVAKGTSLGLPEVTLGILPGAGGTQRLPRLAGPATALEMMTGGKPIKAERGAEIGLADRLAEGDVVEAALAFIHEQPDLAVRRTRDLPAPDVTEAVAAARAKLKPAALSAAPARIIDCVEAAGRLFFAEGMRFEGDAVFRLMASDASKGLRHVFFGERKVAQIPGLPRDTVPRAIASVGVVGAGTMGTGIAIALLNAELKVVLVDSQADGLERSIGTIRSTIEKEVGRGRITAEAAAKRLDALTSTGDLHALSDVDLVIEAVFEDMAVKAAVFRELDAIARPGAILASNTSMLNLDTIAGFTARPQDVVGLHFFSPANIMRLLEVVRGAKTSPEVLASAMAFAKRIGKVGVVAGVCDGFIGNRMFEECLRQMYFLLEEGALPQEIDAAMEAFGMAMGPVRVLDLAGQDVAWSVRKRRRVDMPERPYSTFPDKLCELGRFGQKSGKGMYLYRQPRVAEPDPEVEALLIAHSTDEGIARRAIPAEEIVDRCVLSMVNEGARIVADGTAYRPVDIDVVFTAGYGFPPERGGPMFYADTVGSAEVVRRIEMLQSGPHGELWEVAPLLEQLAAEGGSFESLNR